MGISQDRTIVVGTRGSALAMWQAEHVLALLRGRFPRRQFAVKQVRTRGDATGDVALAEIGTRGIFVKEIQDQLLAGVIDLGVHSLKDLPSEDLPGTTIAAVSAREDPRDVLVSRFGGGLAGLPHGATVGTSSPRRAAQLRAFRPDLTVTNVRGNVDTRVRKGLGKEYDGVILAAAGLHRLGLGQEIGEYIPLAVLLPAPGQGIIAVEARAGDADVLALAAAIDDRPAHLAARAERAFVRRLGGGCFTPLGAYAVVREDAMYLRGMLASPDGVTILRREAMGAAANPEALGTQLAEQLLAEGGAEIMATIDTAGGGDGSAP